MSATIGRCECTYIYRVDQKKVSHNILIVAYFVWPTLHIHKTDHSYIELLLTYRLRTGSQSHAAVSTATSGSFAKLIYWNTATIHMDDTEICGIFIARCTLVQSAVLRSHVVCLSL